MNQRVQDLLKKLPPGIDAALIGSPANRFYFSGVRSSAGALFLTMEAAYFIIDFRYIELARRTAEGFAVVMQEKLNDQLAEIIAKHEIKSVAVEEEVMSVGAFLDLGKTLAHAEVSAEAGLSKIISRQRRIKSADELARIRSAQEITDGVFAHILDFIKPGKTEKEIALEIYNEACRLGASGMAFDTIAAAGENGSLPHAEPGDRPLRRGDLLTMDFGAALDGYMSDMTRTVAVGRIDEDQQRMYATALRAQLAALDAIKPGMLCRDIDKTARDIIYGAGYEGCFGHGLGHGVGIEVHESPRLGEGSDDICEPGMVITVEPGIYVENKYGCRIEDMVYVAEDGVVNMTKSPKGLIVV